MLRKAKIQSELMDTLPEFAPSWNGEDEMEDELRELELDEISEANRRMEAYSVSVFFNFEFRS